jgi:hypothetical protein
MLLDKVNPKSEGSIEVRNAIELMLEELGPYPDPELIAALYCHRLAPS